MEDTTITEALGTHPYFGELVSDTLVVDGNIYTIDSEEAKTASTDWKWLRGYTIKSGANVNLDQYNNVFINLGYLSKAPRFNRVYTNWNTLHTYIRNEVVEAIEGGYSYRSSSFSVNLNTYYTKWNNKPVTVGENINDDWYSDVVPMNALHKGVEMDGIYKINRKLSIEGLPVCDRLPQNH